MCSFLKTGNSNVRDIILWLSFGSPSESKFRLIAFYILRHRAQTNYQFTINTLFTKTDFSHKSYKSLLSCTLEKRNYHCTLITEKWLASVPCILETKEQIRILLFHRSLETNLTPFRINNYYQTHLSCTHTGKFPLNKIHWRCWCKSLIQEN